MSSAPTADEIARDARWLAQALDPGSNVVRLVEMSNEAYRAASFLDDRLFQQPANTQVLPWPQVEAAVPVDAREDARWIFHIGHVGSTLVARLLGELDGVLSVREPRILRDVALLEGVRRSAYISPLRRLFSRTFAPTETAIIKATSFVSEIAAELIPPVGRALFMFAQPRAYIESILAGENSRKELHALSGFRAGRMDQRELKLEVLGKSDAHHAAAAWACEMTSLEAAAEACGEQSVAWADFDRMLRDMSNSLKRAAEFLGLPCTPERVAEIVASPLMGRYSKALEYDYSPRLRRELLEEAAFHNKRDIDDALRLLEVTAQTSPLLERALTRTGAEI